jgi:hypothetical protein
MFTLTTLIPLVVDVVVADVVEVGVVDVFVVADEVLDFAEVVVDDAVVVADVDAVADAPDVVVVVAGGAGLIVPEPLPHWSSEVAALAV